MQAVDENGLTVKTQHREGQENKSIKRTAKINKERRKTKNKEKGKGFNK